MIDEYILQFDIPVNDTFVMKIGDGLDELETDILDFMEGERIVAFDVVEEGLVSCVLNYEVDFS